MSIKINALIPAAAAAANIAAPTAPPVAEPLLATLPVSAIYCSEIADGSGKFMMFASVGLNEAAVVRVVAGTDGNVKLYSTAISALKAAKAANLTGPLKFALYEKTAAVGDPLASLEARYKTACAKGFAAQSKQAALLTKMEIAEQFGWHESTGATLTEYQDLVARKEVTQEWEDEAMALISTLAARLSSVGVNPASVANAPPPQG